MRPQGDNGAMDSGGCCCARPRVQQQARPEKRSYPRGLWRGVFRHAPFFVALKVAPAFVSGVRTSFLVLALLFLFWFLMLHRTSRTSLSRRCFARRAEFGTRPRDPLAER